MSEISNIVPIQQEVPAPVQVTQDQSAYIRQLAVDSIAFMEEEFPNNICDLFWESVIEAARTKIVKQEAVVGEVKILMNKSQQKLFMEHQLPWGKYVGQKVGTVLKKDREGLDRMANNPLPFQTQLSRFLESLPPPKPSRKKKG